MGTPVQNWNKFLTATFRTNAEKFFQLADNGCFTDKLTEDCHLLGDVAFPLYYITICWDIILCGYDEWNDDVRPQLYKKKLDNDRIKEFFINRHLNMDSIPFENYTRYFFCKEKDATVDDCLGQTKEELMAKRHREVDIDLYCSAEKFDFENVARLIKGGANPKHRFPGDCECLDRITSECSFLEVQLKGAMFDPKYQIDYEQDIPDLIGLAAHTKMERLLTKKAY